MLYIGDRSITGTLRSFAPLVNANGSDRLACESSSVRERLEDVRRHQRVLVDLLRAQIGGIAVIGVAPVGDVHCAAEIAEQRAVAARLAERDIDGRDSPSISAARRGTPKKSRKVGAISIDCVSPAQR